MKLKHQRLKKSGIFGLNNGQIEKIEEGEIKPIAERSDEKRMHCGIAFET